MNKKSWRTQEKLYESKKLSKPETLNKKKPKTMQATEIGNKESSALRMNKSLPRKNCKFKHKNENIDINSSCLSKNYFNFEIQEV